FFLLVVVVREVQIDQVFVCHLRVSRSNLAGIISPHPLAPDSSLKILVDKCFWRVKASVPNTLMFFSVHPGIRLSPHIHRILILCVQGFRVKKNPEFYANL
ncbi:MAG: hypothetical protein ACOC2L_03650, partial [Candidatus Sumerlaeota bacterium]